MADLINIFGGSFTATKEKTLEPPEKQLREAIIDAGLEPPDSIYMDGNIHRFKTGSKGSGGAGDKTGWYVAYNDSIPAGRFGDWRSGIEVTFRADVGRKFTPAEEMAHTRRMSEAKIKRDEELKKQHEVVSHTVEKIWEDCTSAHPDHPYLKRKGINVHGARVTGDGRLVVPLFNEDGSLSTIQYIANDGTKLYHKGGATGGKYWTLGNIENPKIIYIAEGFATAATINEATGSNCIIAYSASNLVPVTESIRIKYGAQQEIVIIADNDKSGVGQKYADQASAKFGGRVVVMPIEGDANDYVQAGHDLLALLNPPSDDWLIQADEFSQQPAPIKWLIKGWVQEASLMMIHGPSGGGKTFAVLDMCLTIASGMDFWANLKVKHGTVVYLCGEGHHGVRSRIAAWKHKKSISRLNMYISRDGLDLNTPAGYQRTVENLRKLQDKPKVIIVDTLHRFLQGDENSAQDTKTMLDACSALIIEFGCAVILVHHTGVSNEAQHRARGSSAWRGALDIEISVIPSTDGKPMQLVQRKSKDAELSKDIFCELESVIIPDWYDEDDEPVSSAVLAILEESDYQPVKKESKLDGFRKVWESAWWATNAEIRNDKPYLTRSGLKEKLMIDGVSERTAVNKINPSREGDLIHTLLNGEIIQAFEHGWIMIDLVQISVLLMRKNG